MNWERNSNTGNGFKKRFQYKQWSWPTIPMKVLEHDRDYSLSEVNIAEVELHRW